MNFPQQQQTHNEQKMSYICDEIINVLKFIKLNKCTYDNNKDEMLCMVKTEMVNFYNNYPQICRTIVFEYDMTQIIEMI